MKSFVFIIAFLFLVRPLIPVIDYVVNYEYISTKLCENKDKPELNCNGKCHVAKKISESTNSDNTNKLKSNSEVEILFFQTDNFDFRKFIFHTKSITKFHYENLYFHMSSSDYFHPPC
ncbi:MULTISPECIES: hypothetical protein [Flavobacterium]|uniref:Uncharacterized protein n=2 Tax=Flavobacterium TaxID=237 RepID=A0A1M6J4U0_9FLAO|nr:MULTISPECIES: hypothetical protein [Flavobacterium]BCY28349.1 hypothetical protein KK2020170_12170 [Flavobacterium okayamense]SHJ41720.1 hypothetical protein SAMN05444337_1969 [Flavobacterium haoranii]